jgi:Peptidase C39 family
MASTVKSNARVISGTGSTFIKEVIMSIINLPFRSQPAGLKRAFVAASTERNAQSARAPVNLPGASQVGAGADLRRNDCGPACVRMAFDFLGAARGVTIDQLAAQIDVADDGTTPDELVRLAKSYGVDAFTQALPPTQLPEAPAILLIRYNGFPRDAVQDKRFWDLSAANPNVWHWAWWLGNTTINGKAVSVWNDPLFTGQNGKALTLPADALERAFAPYFGTRVAVRFPAIFNPPTTPISVVPRDADGVNLRSLPELRPETLIRRIPAGAVLRVEEDADGARVKIASGQQVHWLRVRTPEGQLGFVAAWLVVPFAAPPSGLTALNTVFARQALTLHAQPNAGAVWSVADGVPLKVLPSNGADWPIRLSTPGQWLEVESYAFKRGFVRADAVALPQENDVRTPVDDARCKFGDAASLYGIHDDFGPRRTELFQRHTGWVLFTEEAGSGGTSPYAAWASNPPGFGVLVRLNNAYNNGYQGNGTIPGPSGYDAFAQRCAAWAQRVLAGRNSDWACTFIIGNEMNNPREWHNPNGASDQLNMNAAISPQQYAECFNRVYRAIKAVAPNARVAPGAIDPYNAQYMDCLQYFTQMLARIDNLDAITLHAYTHGPEVSRITSLGTFQNDPLRWQYYDFRCYTTLLDCIPAKWRNVPVHITETDQTPTEQQPVAWSGGRNGWVRAAYEEIDRWNRQPFAQQIQSLIMYRWARGGGSDAAYCLQDKPDILEEFKATVASTDFRWRFAPPAAPRRLPVVRRRDTVAAPTPARKAPAKRKPRRKP